MFAALRRFLNTHLKAGSSSLADLIAAFAAIANTGILVLGGIAGYFLIQNKVVDATLRKEEIATRIAEAQQARDSAPIVNLGLSVEGSEGGATGPTYLSLVGTVENDGLVPVELGSIRLEVSSAMPDDEVASMLRITETDESAPAAPPPPLSNDAAQSPSKTMERTRAPVVAPRPKKWDEGRLYNVGSSGLEWVPIPELDEKLIRRVTLYPEQSRRFRFSFLIDATRQPHWYRFVLTAETKTAGSNNHDPASSWQSQSASHIVRFGPFPWTCYRGVCSPQPVSFEPPSYLREPGDAIPPDDV